MILQSVRRYRAYSLSYRNIEEMMEERGVEELPSVADIHKKIAQEKSELHKRYRREQNYLEIM